MLTMLTMCWQCDDNVVNVLTLCWHCIDNVLTILTMCWQCVDNVDYVDNVLTICWQCIDNMLTMLIMLTMCWQCWLCWQCIDNVDNMLTMLTICCQYWQCVDKCFLYSLDWWRFRVSVDDWRACSTTWIQAKVLPARVCLCLPRSSWSATSQVCVGVGQGVYGC